MSNTTKVMLEGYQKRKMRGSIVIVLLLLLTLVLAILSLICGNTQYSLSTILRVLSGESIKGATFAIKTLRLPRMLAGLLAGIAFGMAGNTFQTLLRNPLASPDIIGVTSGSSVAAVFCILILNLSGNIVSFFALISGIIVAGVIYLLSRGDAFRGRLILVGIGVQAMLSAVLSFILLKAAQYDVASALRWLSGSLNGVQMDSIPRLFFVVIIGGIIMLSLSRHIQTIQLGEEYAVTLGVNTNVIYLVSILSAVILIAFSTSVTGPIASIAFLSGPIAAKLTGNGRSNVLPAGLVGASLVLAADLIGQFAFEARYPVGVITGILGAPYLLFLLIRMNSKGASV